MNTITRNILVAGTLGAAACVGQAGLVYYAMNKDQTVSVPNLENPRDSFRYLWTNEFIYQKGKSASAHSLEPMIFEELDLKDKGKDQIVDSRKTYYITFAKIFRLGVEEEHISKALKDCGIEVVAVKKLKSNDNRYSVKVVTNFDTLRPHL